MSECAVDKASFRQGQIVKARNDGVAVVTNHQALFARDKANHPEIVRFQLALIAFHDLVSQTGTVR